jgi:tRNA (Thr-GGU) A37 N-methylase
VEVVDIEDNQITVRWLDAWDGSPLLDIKPYWQEIDTPD